MAWDLNAAIATLSRAMELESEGRAFYLKAAAQTQDEAGKKMFVSLAADEEEHFDTLKRERDSLGRAGKWLSSVDVVSRQPVRWTAPQIFPRTEQAIKEIVKPSAGDIEALKVGLKAETDSYNLYTESGEKADDPDAKALFKFLAAEEMGHYRLLESALAYLDDTASFFLIQDRAINEG